MKGCKPQAYNPVDMCSLGIRRKPLLFEIWTYLFLQKYVFSKQHVSNRTGWWFRIEVFCQKNGGKSTTWSHRVTIGSYYVLQEYMWYEHWKKPWFFRVFAGLCYPFITMRFDKPWCCESFGSSPKKCNGFNCIFWLDIERTKTNKIEHETQDRHAKGKHCHIQLFPCNHGYWSSFFSVFLSQKWGF